MPRYTFKNSKTGEEETLDMKISEREQYLKDNPDVEQVISAGTPFVESRKLLGNFKSMNTDYKSHLNNINKYYKTGRSY